MSHVERDACGFCAPILRNRGSEKEHSALGQKKGLAVMPALLEKSCGQNVKWTPNSLQIERGMNVALGATKPIGWPKVPLAILLPKLFP
jgi:hypothetical protein